MMVHEVDRVKDLAEVGVTVYSCVGAHCHDDEGFQVRAGRRRWWESELILGGRLVHDFEEKTAEVNESV